MQCVICSSDSFHIYENFPKLKRVTSDAKPWVTGGKLVICEDCKVVQKVVDEKWLEEISEIYKNYDVYYQSNGQEQAVFSPSGIAQKRSQPLTKFIQNPQFNLDKTGKVLDFGCGNGEFLTEFSKQFPEFELFGADLSDKYLPQLNSIPNFKELFSSENCPEETFDLITLIHTLEHLVTPIETLLLIKKYLKKEGMLFIQVPNVLESPFDILIADHLTHLAPENFVNILSRAGFELIGLETNIVSKEITLMAKPSISSLRNINIDISNMNSVVNSHIKLIDRILTHTEQIKKKGDFGIFGTSISATWLYNNFPEASFFIDEDPNRIGKTLFDKPIYAPHEVYGEKVPIVIPLAESIANPIIDRHFIHINGSYFPKELHS